uniref:Uncharacterized protein n=1 Tax=Triticum urartu TaxID=4572 RepID=A0A8R7P9J3_TRIUA
MSGSPRKDCSLKVPNWPVVETLPERSGLYDPLNITNCVSLNRLAGSSSERLLNDKSILSRDKISPISDGIGPEMLFLETFSMTSGRRPISGGSCPVRRLPSRRSKLRFRIAPIRDGISPESMFLDSCTYPGTVFGPAGDQARIGTIPLPLRMRSHML